MEKESWIILSVLLLDVALWLLVSRQWWMFGFFLPQQVLGLFHVDGEVLKSFCLSQGHSARHKLSRSRVFNREHCLSRISDLFIETFYSASAKTKTNKKSLPPALSLPAASQSVNNRTNHRSTGCLLFSWQCSRSSFQLTHPCLFPDFTAVAR